MLTQGAIGWFIQRDLDHGVQPSSYNQRKEHQGDQACGTKRDWAFAAWPKIDPKLPDPHPDTCHAPSVKSNFPRLCSGIPVCPWPVPWGNPSKPFSTAKWPGFSSIPLQHWAPHLEGIHGSPVRHSLISFPHAILGEEAKFRKQI